MRLTKRPPKTDPLNAPVLGDAIPRGGNSLTRKIARGLMRLLGWRFSGSIPNLPKMVLIGVPHTSNWDFLLAMVALSALQVRVYWLGKHTFVNGPLKPFLRRLGGVAVDRRAAYGVVGQTVAAMQQHEQFILGLAPEGTRSFVHHWKMGFFFIAQAANVPIVPAALDYGRKTIALGDTIWPEVGETAVLSQLRTFYTGVKGKYPDQFSVDSIQPRLRNG